MTNMAGPEASARERFKEQRETKSPPLPSSPSAPTLEQDVHMRIDSIVAYYAKNKVLKGISLPIARRKITAIIGPSGCGKSTLLRCINRMHEETRGARAEGGITLDGEDIHSRLVDPVKLRRRVGMVFQKPNPFPTMSIFENVAAGLRLNQMFSQRSALTEKVERALRMAALWDEVKDKMEQPGTALSGGQQQRLCIARALAVEPEVLLMDEPCSALDPIATAAIEDLMKDLAKELTIVIVTHNMQQAARVSDYTAFLLVGELVEFGDTHHIFTTPTDPRTEAYITGRFG